MSNKHLQRTPHTSKKLKTAWWYEEPHGVSVIVEPSTTYTHIKISWTAIRHALRRKDRP